FLVGMGTQMAGGCSSGHGLSGCANLSWSSLLATGIFFSTAVVVANAIKLVM
ncbi:MAG: YeeE/YedE thiosulfate transporter family protein, partial [Gammaproteobacteria bacterium]